MIEQTGPVMTQLRDRVRGRLTLPNDPDYVEARRVWNGMIDRHPAAIVRTAGVADVLAAVRVAREHNLQIAAQWYSAGQDRETLATILLARKGS